MKMDMIDGDAVNLRFGLGEPGEDVDGGGFNRSG